MPLMFRKPFFLLLTFLLALGQGAPLAAQQAPEARTALVIGIGEYTSTYFTRLEAPPEDATKMAAKLKALGFDVTLKVNATRKEMLDLTDAFGKTLAQKQGVGLFYFSGHGSIKPDEEAPNYLIPAGSNPVSREDLPQEAFNAQRVANRMIDAGNRLNLIFLDACRNNALPGRTKDASGGLASMRGASGLMFFFATQPHQVALEDSVNKRSLFTASLLKHIDTPGLSFLDMMGDVTAATETHSLEGGGKFKQTPFMSGSLSGRFAFVPESISKAPPTPPTSSAPAGSVTTPKAGDTMTIDLPGGEKMTFCYCPAGSFTMGSPASERDRRPDEEQVPVRISKGFWMAKTECTQGQWQAVMGSNPSKFTGSKDLPVEKVRWGDVQAFIAKLNGLVKLPPGVKLVLPTEAQWEYACRAGTESAFAFGETLTSEQANFDGTDPYGTLTKGAYLKKTSEVGSYAANAWGIHDMHGNVLEWCQDPWDGVAKNMGGTDPMGTSGTRGVSRGGSWSGVGKGCRSAIRVETAPGNGGDYLGFRLAAVPIGR